MLSLRWFEAFAARRARRRDRHCGVYALDQTALVLPHFGISSSLDHAVAAPLAGAPLGQAVLEALRVSRPRSRGDDMASMIAAFEARMESFRLEIGAGKQRFMRDLQHVSAYRKDGVLKISQFRAVHGRFAFEGTGQAIVLAGDDLDDPQAIGAAVLTLLAD